jgi:hypothetical protein
VRGPFEKTVVLNNLLLGEVDEGRTEFVVEKAPVSCGELSSAGSFPFDKLRVRMTART